MRALPLGLVTILLTVQTTIGGIQTPQQETGSAARILAVVADIYKTSRTYSDSGVVKTAFIKQGDTTHTTEVRFMTAFVRPDQFRFEFSEYLDKRFGDRPPKRTIVWQRGKEVRFWSDIEPGVSNESSLGLAVAKATGVSNGSAHTIPFLLLPEEVGGNGLTSLKDFAPLEKARLGETVCFLIHAKFVGDPTTIWIDSKTLLIRRIDSVHVSENFYTQETTTYEPVVNGQVSEEKLAFGAPGQK